MVRVNPGPGTEVGSTGIGGSFFGCFGKRTCITGPRGLGQILPPTVVAWGTRQAAIQALGQWVWVVVAPRAGELGGVFGA